MIATNFARVFDFIMHRLLVLFLFTVSLLGCLIDALFARVFDYITNRLLVFFKMSLLICFIAPKYASVSNFLIN